MKISDKEIRRLAGMAGLSPDSEGLAAIGSDLDKIISYFDEMNELDTTGVEPTYQVTGLSNVWREDVVEEQLGCEALLGLAPDRRDDGIRVPKVL